MAFKITLITGGARSGKSKYALDLALQYPNPAFIATAQPTDQEMEARIKAHQEERAGQFVTIEAPLDLDTAIAHLPEGTGVVVVDCLTLWLNNLLFKFGEQGHDSSVEALLDRLKNLSCPVIFVTNELGMGLVPEHPLSRAFRDMAGRLNQQIAGVADEVVLMVCGLPLPVKS